MIGSFFATVWGRIIGVLTAITLIGGIATEVVGARTAYNEAEIKTYQAEYAGIAQKAEADQARFRAEIARQKAANAALLASAEASEKGYTVEIDRQKALNAEVLQRAESDRVHAESEIEDANSQFRQRQLEAEADQLDAETANLRQSINLLNKKLTTCGRPCKGQGRDCFSNCDFNNDLSGVIGR